jgi:hypothetical protein
MAIDYAAEIEALKLAIASGAKSVSYDGKSVQYDDIDKMLERLRILQSGRTARLTGRPQASRPSAGAIAKRWHLRTGWTAPSRRWRRRPR